MTAAILVLNSGSSSVKFAVYEQAAALTVLLRPGCRCEVLMLWATTVRSALNHCRPVLPGW